jgi:hypothetical protein
MTYRLLLMVKQSTVVAVAILDCSYDGSNSDRGRQRQRQRQRQQWQLHWLLWLSVVFDFLAD